MSLDLVFALLQNAALLMATVTAYDVLVARFEPSGAPHPLKMGLLVGLIGVGVMHAPLRLDAALTFDTRSVLLCLAGLFLHPLGTLLAASLMAASRVVLGGAWLAGVTVIATSALLGVAWRRRVPDLGRLSIRQLYVFGLLVHAVMLADLFASGWAVGLDLLRHVGPPVMLVYPVATAAIGAVLSDRWRQMQTRRSLVRATRAAQALSEAARAVTRATDEDELLREICRICVEVSDYHMVWVGLAETDDARSVRLAARRGIPSEAAASLRMSWDEAGPHGRSPSCTAIRERRVVSVQDTARDPSYEPWRAPSRALGYGSSIALPLCFEDGQVGVLSVYARSPDAFHDQEQQLLVDLAASVTFGVSSLRQRAARGEAEARTALEARRAEVLLALPALAEQGDEHVFVQAALAHAEELTGSPISFAHLVRVDQVTLELTAWSRRTMEVFCHAKHFDHHPLPEAGLWAEALRRREPVVIDDYANADGRRGMPEDHSPLRRFVSVPVIDGGLVRMIVGVGNKPGSYEDLDVETVLLIAQTTWRIVRQRRSDRELRAAVERLDLALEAGQHGTYDLDLETGRTTVSPRYATMLGYDPATFSETYDSWMARLHPDDRPATEAAAQAYLAGEAPSYRVESRALDAHGEWRWIQAVGAIVERGSDGRPRRAIGTHTDITDRKRAEAHLQQLAQAVEQSPESIAITDLAGDMEYVNASFERVSGYARAEVLGKNPRMLQSAETPRETYEKMWSTLTRGDQWRGMLINRRKDGSTYVESSIIAPLRRPGDGAITHYIAVKQDVTEKLRVEAELDRHRDHLEELVQLRTEELAQARDTAESANRAKSAFLANMSHEIRTPLNAIVGLAHLLRREAPTADLRRRLDQIDAASRHLLSIISDILDLSKIEAGRLELDPVDFSLRALLTHVTALVGDAASAKGLGIAVDDPTPDLVLRGDEIRLRQALLNYASNAVKFTRRGAITLGARVVARSAEGVTVHFEVRDTGPGIPAAKLARLFAVFEQGDSSTTREHGGTGLGLAITRSIARLMDGEAGAESVPGESSTFWFTARLAPGEAASPAALALDPGDLERDLAQRAGCRVLLVEDNAINREVATALLRSVGLMVERAEDGVEAIEVARRSGYDLVLMDLHMPRMDGLEATRAIRALPGWARRPIVAMTATTSADDRRDCLEAGMDDFVPKPFEPRALFATLLRWLPAEGHGCRAPGPSSRPPSPGEALPEWALAVDGLDARAGLRRMGGATERYIALLARFARDHRGDADPVRQAVWVGDVAGARQRVHALRGAAATVGAERLATRARHVEELLVAGEPADDDAGRAVDALAECLRELTDALIARTSTASEAPGAALAGDGVVDWHRAAQAVARLALLLETGNIRSRQVYEEHAPVLRAALGGAAPEFELRLRTFDYPEALDVLRRTLMVEPRLRLRSPG